MCESLQVNLTPHCGLYPGHKKNIAYTENTEPHYLNAEQIISLVAESAEFCFCLLVGDMIA